MENNEYEETQETEETQENEETQESSSEDVKDGEDSQEETKDWKAEALKYKAIAERKEKKLQNTTNKTNNKEQPKTQAETPDFIELARLANKYTDTQLDLLKDIQEVKGFKNLTEASNSPLFQAQLKYAEEEERSKKASLGASNRDTDSEKEPSKDDLKKRWLKK